MALCFECGQLALHEHHVVPFSQGGTKTIPLCEEHHGKIHDANLTISALIKEGMAQAKARGVQLGAPRRHDWDEVFRRHDAGQSKEQIARGMGIPWETVKKILRKRACK